MDAHAVTSSPRPPVGVVIRTLNESEHIGQCIDVLHGQRGEHALDILVIDSGSHDATVEIAQSRGARTIEIAPQDFDYSKTLNEGIEAVDGDIVLILSAHAIPLDDGWVSAMLAPFADPAVAGVASRQVPWPDAPFREAHRLAETFGAASRSFAGSDARDVVFSNAASAVRRSVWQQERFTLPAAEDIEWAQRVVGAGWTVVYEARAQVHHSHTESPRALARRLIDINRGGIYADRNRTLYRTLRDAATYLKRDLRLIVGLDQPLRQKLRHTHYAVLMVAFYVVDFSKSGSTAELRRK